MHTRHDRTSSGRILFVALALLIGCLFHAASSWAWGSPPGDIAVFQTVTSATVPHIVSDGAHGAIITSGSNNGPASTGIFTQRINANGSSHAEWPANGVKQPLSGQDNSVTVSDGQGGTIVVWEDYRNTPAPTIANPFPTLYSDIYAQRYNAEGDPLWGAGGVPVSLAADDQSFPELVSDGAGGAIIVWYDLRSGSNYDIYAQRIDANGNALWTTDGVPVSTAANDQWNPELISDGAGGAIIVWQDTRNDPNNSAPSIFAQRIDPNGNALWAGNGVAVSLAANELYPKLVGDGAGGAIIVWQDDRNSTGTSDIYAQRIDANGHQVWAADAPVTTYFNDQLNPQITSDGAGGAIVVWEDYGNDLVGGTADIYAQRIDATGSPVWAVNSVPVVTAANSFTGNPADQAVPQLAGDGAGGAIIVWEDYRDDPSGLGEATIPRGVAYIYAQWLDATGTAVWAPDGVPVSNVANSQNPQVIFDTVEGSGAIVAWEDYRNIDPAIYAQRLNSSGAASSFNTPSFDVKFEAGAHGSLTGQAYQTIISGASATAVTAVPATGYQFVNWTGTGGFTTTTTNPLTVANVTAAQTITAHFAVTTFTVTPSAGTGGSISPATPQTVNYNATASFTVTPAAGYSIASVTGCGGTLNGTTYTTGAITGACSVTASFGINTFSVSFSAATGGTLTGTASQTVNYGASASAVTAVPTTGYSFVNWTGTGGFVTSTANPLTVSNVTASQAITANFSINTFVVTFAAATGGTLTGSSSQTVNYGASASAVTAVPSAGYSFVNWTGTGGFVATTANPLTVNNVTASQAITANFAAIPPTLYTVTFAAGANGTVSGTTSQTVTAGTSTSAVTAVPATGYQFVNWTGTGGFVTSTANPLIVNNVTASQAITANFAVIPPTLYTITFAAGANGTVSGTTSQTVTAGTSTSAVTAVPGTGYHFVNWTGTGGFISTANPLIVSNVAATLSITANFAQDTAPPITSASPVAGTYSNSVTVTLSTNQGGTIYYTTDGTTPTTASPVYTGPITLAPTATQTYTVKYFAVDRTGTVEAVESTAYTVHVSDLTGSIQINGGTAYAKSAAVSLALSATDPKGVASMQFSNDGATYSTAEPYATSKNWTLTSGDGPKTVYVKFIDSLGEVYPAYTAQITVDSTVPATTATPPAGVYAGTVSVALTASETATIYYTTDGTQPTTASRVYTGPIPLTTAVTGNMTLTFYAVDQAGNAETAQALVYTIHQPDLAGTVMINNGAGFTNSRNVTLGLSATDPDGVTQMQVACDGQTFAAAEAFATTKACALPAGDGLKTVSVKFMDGLGVWYPAVSGQITLDTTPPVTGITPVAGTYDGSVKITLSPSKTATIYYTTDGTTPTTASPVYGGPITLSSATTQTFNVQYFAVDKAGNAEAVRSAAYVIHVSDMVGSITINNGASYTTATAVTLTLSATDPQGVASMQFSNDGSNYSALEPYATSKSWTLNGGDGLKTVYVRFVDGAGIQYTFPASIILATAAAGSTPGDLNGDGKVDIADALKALQISVGLFQPTTAELVRGDVAPVAGGKPAPDGVIDTADALVILKLSLGLITW